MPESRWPPKTFKNSKRPIVWSDKTQSRYNALVLTRARRWPPDTARPTRPTRRSWRPSTRPRAQDLRRERLPATARQAAVAVDHEGRIVVSLENGQVTAFVGKD